MRKMDLIVLTLLRLTGIFNTVVLIIMSEMAIRSSSSKSYNIICKTWRISFNLNLLSLSANGYRGVRKASLK